MIINLNRKDFLSAFCPHFLQTRKIRPVYKNRISLYIFNKQTIITFITSQLIAIFFIIVVRLRVRKIPANQLTGRDFDFHKGQNRDEKQVTIIIPDEPGNSKIEYPLAYYYRIDRYFFRSAATAFHSKHQRVRTV